MVFLVRIMVANDFVQLFVKGSYNKLFLDKNVFILSDQKDIKFYQI